MSMSDTNSSLGPSINRRKRSSSQVTLSDLEDPNFENMSKTLKMASSELERDLNNDSEVSSASSCRGGPCCSGSNLNPTSSSAEVSNGGYTKNSTMMPTEILSASHGTPLPGQGSVSIECPPVGSSRTLFHSSLREPQEQVVIPTFSESDDENVVSENRSLLLDHLPRQNRSDSHGLPSCMSFRTRPTHSSSSRDPYRLVPRHLRPRTSAYSVSVTATVTSSSPSVTASTSSSSSSRGMFVPQSVQARSVHDADFSEDESSVSLSDLFELEESGVHFRSSRTPSSFHSLHDVTGGNRSDRVESVLTSGGGSRMQLGPPHFSGHSDVPGPSSSSSGISLITVGDAESLPDRSSTSVGRVDVHQAAGNRESRPNVASRPEVIIVSDSSEDEEEDVVFIGSSGRAPVGPEIIVSRHVEQPSNQDSGDMRPPRSLWNFPPTGVSMQIEPFPPGLRSFRRQYGDISLSFHMDARRLFVEDILSFAGRIGPARTRGGLSSKTINSLPYRKFGSGKSTDSSSTSMSSTSCAVCMADYTHNERIKALPCLHEFHSRCIGRWLKDNRTCPVCRYIMSDCTSTNCGF